MHGLNRPLTRLAAARRPDAGRSFSVRHRRRAGRRIRLAARRQLAGGDARPRACSTRRSAPTSRPRTPTPRPRWRTPRRCRTTLFAEMKGAHQGGRQLRAGARWRLRLLHELRHRRPVSARRAGARAAAAPSRSCSTATRGRGQAPTGSSAAPPTAPTTGCSPTPSTTRAPSSTPSASAIWRRAGTCADAIPDTRGAIVWARDSADAVLCAPRRATTARSVVYRHAVGTPAEDDVLVYEEKDIGFYVGVGQTQSGKLHPHRRPRPPDQRGLPDRRRRARRAPPRLVAPRQHGHEYARRAPRRPADHHHQLGRRGGLPHLRGAAGRPRPWRNWREIIAAQAGPPDPRDRRLRDHLVRLEREDGLPRIVVRRFADGSEHAIAFDEEAYSLGMSPGYEFDTTTLRFTYSSMTTPAQVFDYDMETRTRMLRKTPGGAERPQPGRLRDAPRSMRRRPTARRCRSRSSTARAPPLDGSAPLFLYGYGAYGIAIPACVLHHAAVAGRPRLRLSPSPISAAARTRATAGTRSGKLENKVNTFTDFIAAGEYLAAARLHPAAGASSPTAARPAAC